MKHRVGMMFTLFTAVALLGISQGQGTDLLSRLRAGAPLRVANTQASPPWNFLDANNQVAGYDIEIARELAARMGVANVQFIATPFAELIPGLQTDKWDITIASQTPTDERKKVVDFSVPYQVNVRGLFVRSSDETIKSLTDLAGKRVAVTAGSTNGKFVTDRVPSAVLQTYDNVTLALTDVNFGRADASLFSRYVGLYLIKKNKFKVKVLSDSAFGVEVNAMAIKKGDATFKAAIDKAFTGMVNDGTLTLISRKWIGEDMSAALKAALK